MKMLLATVLAAAAITIATARVAPMSGPALAGGGGPDKWCGAAVCPPKRPYSGSYQMPSGSYQTPSTSYRGQR